MELEGYLKVKLHLSASFSNDFLPKIKRNTLDARSNTLATIESAIKLKFPSQKRRKSREIITWRVRAKAKMQ